MARLDPHSYTDDTQPSTQRLEWRCRVDFESRTLEGEVTLHFATPGEGRLDLDTRDLRISSVHTVSGALVPFTLHPRDPVLGQRLQLGLPPATTGVRVRYRTSPAASALQWLSPEQTQGKQKPYLFSQCQAIHARSMLPL